MHWFVGMMPYWKQAPERRRLPSTKTCHSSFGFIYPPLRAFTTIYSLVQAPVFPVPLVLPSQNYLAARGLTWKNVLTESLVALQRGVFLLSGKRLSGTLALSVVPGSHLPCPASFVVLL